MVPHSADKWCTTNQETSGTDENQYVMSEIILFPTVTYGKIQDNTGDTDWTNNYILDGANIKLHGFILVSSH